MSDYDLPSVYSCNVRKARKHHICCECKQTINPGEKYHYHHGLWEGKWADFYVCIECDILRDELEYDGEMAPFGYLKEWAHEADVEFPVSSNP